MLNCGLVQGTAGNVAARLPDGNVVLTPSSLDYRTMTLDDLVVCDLDGNVVEGHRSPTTEKMLHLTRSPSIPTIDATMHCHAKYCTMFALTRQPIPAVIEEVVVYLGGDVPVADYKTTGTGARRRGGGAVARPRRGAHGQPRPVRRRPAARRTRSSSRTSWSAPPRSCGAPAARARSCPCPTTTIEQFSSYYRMGRTPRS